MKKDEMKKKISGEGGLKIFSVVIAICLWFYVVQVQNPETTRTIKNVPVVFTQRALLEEKNLTLLNTDESTIDIEIRGPRKNVTGVNRQNLTVLADVGGISATGSQVVVTNVVLPYANLTVVGKNPSALKVSVDDLVSVEKPVKVQPEGNPKESYVVGEVSAVPETILVKGPKSIVDGIDFVAATIDVDGKTADVAGKEPLLAMGSGNQEIVSSLLTFSHEEIEVRAEVLKAKSANMELIFSEEMQNFAGDYELDKNSIKSVRIAGVQTLVESMNKVKTEPITQNDVGENGEVTVRLALPEGVRSLDGETFKLRFSRRLPQE